MISKCFKAENNLTVNVLPGRYHGRESDFQRFGSYDSWSGRYNRWVYPSVMQDMLLSCFTQCALFCSCLWAMSHTDSIEANVESAEVHVEHGTEQLQRAAYYQVQQYRCKKSNLILLWHNVYHQWRICLSLFSPEEVTQEDVYSGFSAVFSGDCLRHYYLASYQIRWYYTFEFGAL